MAFLATLGITSVSTVISFVVTLIICLIAMKIVTNIVHKLLDRTKLDHNVKNIIVTATKIGLWCLAVVIVADSLGISTASLVAVISIAGLALSLSIQDIMANLFSGFVILLAHTFKKGDYVDIGADSGIIEHVGITHTEILTLDNRKVSIPNKNVIGSAVTNYSSEPLRRVDIVYGTDYNDKTEDVFAALEELCKSDAKMLQDPAPFYGILEYKDSTINYVVRVWCKSSDYWDVYFALNKNVRECFENHNVHMSFNHINVHMVN